MFTFHTRVLSGEAPVHVFSLFSHWLSSNLVEFWEFFIYCGYQSAIGNVGCTYSPQPKLVFSLSFTEQVLISMKSDSPGFPFRNYPFRFKSMTSLFNRES